MVSRRTVGLVCLLAACKPDIEDGASRVTSDRVLAVRSEPAEVTPGKEVRYTALLASPQSGGDPDALDFAHCLARKPITVPGPIALECLADSAEALSSLGRGNQVSGVIPQTACRLFGPNPPAPAPGEPAARAADPDPSGGYYQPVRVHHATTGEYSVGVTRLACGVARATQDQSLEFTRRYRLNQNPELDRVTARIGDVESELAEGLALSVPAGSRVTLRVQWRDCPTQAACGDGACSIYEDDLSCAEDCAEPRGCTGAEPYVYFDPETSRIVERRESIRVSWFGTAGSFTQDRTGRQAVGLEGLENQKTDSPESTNEWTAPDVPSEARLWLVIRDDRGGTGFASFVLRVE
ncbi:MAG TPA: hypothetical protein VFQ61_18360 [Polyangiaceae bacterium]|nr:hypothetical protein [Polyangiaceae bacterium]